MIPIVVALVATSVGATENGLLEYPQGVDTVLPGLAPTPNQTQFYNYLEYYSADSLVNSSGKSVLPGFSEDYTADAIRILHTWNFTSGKFSFSSAIVPTLLKVTLSAGGRKNSAFDFTDFVVQPMFANYVSSDHRLFALAGFGVALPTGDYKQTNFVNTGLNIMALESDAAITWFANRQTQVSLKFVGELPGANPATHYHSGTTINFDYSVEYSPKRSKLHYGLQGFASQQITDDTLAGRIYNGGNAERAFGVGPQLRYDMKGGGFALKYVPEFGVENRAKGTHYWFEYAAPL